MTETRTRPPFVLAIMADSQGCGYHRVQVPLASLVESGAADGRIDMSLWPDHVLAACAPDVIVVQRQVEDGALDAIERWKTMLPNTLFVYELDDYLGEIPPASFHASFMPPNIEEKVARGVRLCDRATTTTEPLAEWLRELGARDVRVVPNALPVGKLREREPRMSGRMRIGFAGGMSHSGDLRLIESAMEAIGDAVDWVFFGTRPEDAKDVRIEQHEGMPANLYLDAMLKLDVDLMLAPLEDNVFNRCKSNLRLVEAGAIGACVVAQDLAPYRIDQPPVFAYATTPDEWTAAIRRFVDSKPAERRRSADSLRSWVGRHYVLERRLKDRMEAWLPDGEKWKPRSNVGRHGATVVACTEDKTDLFARMPFLRRCDHETGGLEKACARAISSGGDLMWLRPATSFGEQTWNAMRAAISQALEIASVVPLASDGSNAFPKGDEWMPMSPGNVAAMEKVLANRMRRRRFMLPAPSGPCIVLSASALGMLGAPDVKGCEGNEEQAIMEWGLRAAMREWRHVQAADGFASSLAPPPTPTAMQSLRLQARGTATRLQVPAESPTAEEREAIELELLASQWGGPRPGSLGFGVDYESWKALVHAKAASEHLSFHDVRSGRVPIVSTTEFGKGIGVPFGWLIHVDDDVRLDFDALDSFASAIAHAPEGARVVYADHESLFIDGRLSPEFKPDFDLELFLAQDYVTPLCAVRVNVAFEDRISLYAWILDVAVSDGAKAFVHVPRTLGSMAVRVRPEEMAVEALQRQIAIQEKFGDSVRVSAHRRIPGCLSVVRGWKARAEEAPLVTIVVPTLGGGRLIQPCVNTIRAHTDYPRYEILVVQNGEREEPELNADILADPRVRVVRWNGKFNWSAINNWAIRFHAKGKYIVTMNDDVCTGTKDWLDAMMGHAVLDDVGVVGAKLLHPMGVVQHVGVVAHNGVAGHMHKGLRNGELGHLGRAVLTHEASAVTGACMLFSRRSFDTVNGFDEDMPRNYNDTDFCLRLRAKGLRNVVESTAELLHPEGSSRGDPMSPESLRMLATENRDFAAKHPGVDSYWNPNLSLGLVHGGVLIQGLNAEVLYWNDFATTKRQEKVLLVNDLPGSKGLSLSVLAEGDVPMAADLSGFQVRMRGPIPRNARPWDVRDPERMREGLRLLGITRIVLRSLVGMEGAAPPVEALRCFARLEMPVAIDEIEPGVVMPSEETDHKVFGSLDLASWIGACRDLMPDDSKSVLTDISPTGKFTEERVAGE